MYVNPMKEDAL